MIKQAYLFWPLVALLVVSACAMIPREDCKTAKNCTVSDDNG